jgi:hypothetical protein
MELAPVCNNIAAGDCTPPAGVCESITFTPGRLRHVRRLNGTSVVQEFECPVAHDPTNPHVFSSNMGHRRYWEKCLNVKYDDWRDHRTRWRDSTEYELGDGVSAEDIAPASLCINDTHDVGTEIIQSPYYRDPRYAYYWYSGCFPDTRTYFMPTTGVHTCAMDSCATVSESTARLARVPSLRGQLSRGVALLPIEWLCVREAEVLVQHCNETDPKIHEQHDDGTDVSVASLDRDCASPEPQHETVPVTGSVLVDTRCDVTMLYTLGMLVWDAGVLVIAAPLCVATWNVGLAVLVLCYALVRLCWSAALQFALNCVRLLLGTLSILCFTCSFSRVKEFCRNPCSDVFADVRVRCVYNSRSVRGVCCKWFNPFNPAWLVSFGVAAATLFLWVYAGVCARVLASVDATVSGESGPVRTEWHPRDPSTPGGPLEWEEMSVSVVRPLHAYASSVCAPLPSAVAGVLGLLWVYEAVWGILWLRRRAKQRAHGGFTRLEDRNAGTHDSAASYYSYSDMESHDERGDVVGVGGVKLRRRPAGSQSSGDDDDSFSVDEAQEELATAAGGGGGGASTTAFGEDALASSWDESDWTSSTMEDGVQPQPQQQNHQQKPASSGNDVGDAPHADTVDRTRRGAMGTPVALPSSATTPWLMPLPARLSGLTCNHVTLGSLVLITVIAFFWGIGVATHTAQYDYVWADARASAAECPPDGSGDVLLQDEVHEWVIECEQRAALRCGLNGNLRVYVNETDRYYTSVFSLYQEVSCYRAGVPPASLFAPAFLTGVLVSGLMVVPLGVVLNFVAFCFMTMRDQVQRDSAAGTGAVGNVADNDSERLDASEHVASAATKKTQAEPASAAAAAAAEAEAEGETEAETEAEAEGDDTTQADSGNCAAGATFFVYVLGLVCGIINFVVIATATWGYGRDPLLQFVFFVAVVALSVIVLVIRRRQLVARCCPPARVFTTTDAEEGPEWRQLRYAGTCVAACGILFVVIVAALLLLVAWRSGEPDSENACLCFDESRVTSDEKGISWKPGDTELGALMCLSPKKVRHCLARDKE